MALWSTFVLPVAACGTFTGIWFAATLVLLAFGNYEVATHLCRLARLGRKRAVAEAVFGPYTQNCATSEVSVKGPKMNYGRAGLMEGFDNSAKLIEIGPSYNPTAPKSSGWNTTVVDHATREALIVKYAPDLSVDPDKIEEVDFVWQGGLLAELIPEELHGTYDGFIACHVIEHTTDIVRFLQSAERLLSSDGAVLLIVPDKRKCFDFFRPVSMTSDALVAYSEERQRHTAKTHFENAMYVSHRNGCPAWFDTETAPSTLGPPLSSALAHMRLSERPDYVDAHGWTFTPASFELMMLELAAMGYLNISVVEVQEAPATEFSARMKKGRPFLEGSALENRRLELLNRMVIEIADQSRQIIGSPMAHLSELRKNLRALI